MKPKIFGYACDLGANQAGSAEGPLVLQKSEYLKALGLEWEKTFETKNKKHQLDALTTIQELCKKLAIQIMHRTREQQSFLTIGGDHSSAIGTWSGAAEGLKENLGLIWVDAHMDAHTTQTSRTQNIHGMPLAALLGYGDPQLTHIKSERFSLLPDNLVLIGIRSFEESEANLLKMLKVRIYFMEEVEKRGIHSVMQEAIQHVSEKTKGFGISIDIDAIDPEDAPGISTPEENGIKANDFLESLSLIAKNPHFIGAEIAEFNPKNDRDQKTEKLIAKMIQQLFL